MQIVERTDGLKKKISWGELQVDVKDIAMPKKLPKWEHLDEILDWKKPVFWCCIVLLIKAKWSKVLAPNRIISSRSWSPYGYRIVLRWYVVGQAQKDVFTESNLSCYKVSVTETSLNKY